MKKKNQHKKWKPWRRWGEDWTMAIEEVRSMPRRLHVAESDLCEELMNHLWEIVVDVFRHRHYCGYGVRRKRKVLRQALYRHSKRWLLAERSYRRTYLQGGFAEGSTIVIDSSLAYEQKQIVLRTLSVTGGDRKLRRRWLRMGAPDIGDLCKRHQHIPLREQEINP